MQDMDQSTCQMSPVAGSTVDDLLLVTATFQAEATGSQTPLVKEELRYSIQRKRRRRGQPDVLSSYTEPGPERLTRRDIERQQNRRASNRRAANKCRLKKKALEKLLQEEMAQQMAEIKGLKAENEHLKKSVDGLTDMLKKKQCIGCALTEAADLLPTLLDDAALLHQGE